MSEQVRVLISEDDIRRRIAEIGANISRDMEEKELLVVPILKGGAFFGCELAKNISIPICLDFMMTSSYGSGTMSSGTVNITKDIEEDPTKYHILLVDDIIDTGHTLASLYQRFSDCGAKSVQIATLLDKPDRREVDVEVAYTGFSIPDVFVVGYGMDYDKKYRNLPYVGVVETE